jgi:hypothetical protein
LWGPEFVWSIIQEYTCLAAVIDINIDGMKRQLYDYFIQDEFGGSGSFSNAHLDEEEPPRHLVPVIRWRNFRFSPAGDRLHRPIFNLPQLGEDLWTRS